MTALPWALLLLAVGLLLAVDPSTPTARLRALAPSGGRCGHMHGALRVGGVAWALVGGLAFGVVARVGFGAGLPLLPFLAGALVGGTAGAMVAEAAAGRDRRRREAELLEAVSALAADLRAGRHPADAVAGDPRRTHLESAAVAAVWTVSDRTGAPAAAVLDRVEQDLRTRERHRREIHAQLAGARSTAVLLAALPLLGIGLGAAMGARPLPVLFGTGRGQVALFAGAALDVLGLLWTARIVASAGGRA